MASGVNKSDKSNKRTASSANNSKRASPEEIDKATLSNDCPIGSLGHCTEVHIRPIKRPSIQCKYSKVVATLKKINNKDKHTQGKKESRKNRKM